MITPAITTTTSSAVRFVADRHARRRALAACVAGALTALVAFGPAHAAAHAGSSGDCATCHVVQHTPATFTAAPALDFVFELTPLSVPPAPCPLHGRAPRPQSRGPPR